MNYSKKYGVKQATSISDDSILYGNTPTWFNVTVLILSVVGTAALFVGTVAWYSSLPL